MLMAVESREFQVGSGFKQSVDGCIELGMKKRAHFSYFDEAEHEVSNTLKKTNRLISCFRHWLSIEI